MILLVVCSQGSSLACSFARLLVRRLLIATCSFSRLVVWSFARRAASFQFRHTGSSEFKMADLIHDYRALETARKDAESLVNSDEFWTSGETACLRRMLEESGALSMARLD